jgi:hypothetical protein
MEARKWRKLLQREGPYWFWGLLGKRFRFAYNEHCGKHPKQFKFKSFCPQCYSTFWVSKRWSSFDFSQILGASSTRTIVKSSVLLWLHTLVLAGGTWYMERVTIQLTIKTVTRFNFVYGKYDPMSMTNKSFRSLVFDTRVKRICWKKWREIWALVKILWSVFLKL